MPDGRRVYIAYRKVKEIYRSGERTISDAIRKGTAAWAIDDETLIQIRAQGIPYIGVLVSDTKDLFLTTTEAFFDRGKSKVLNYERRGGSLQRFLPLGYFRRRPGKVRI